MQKLIKITAISLLFIAGAAPAISAEKSRDTHENLNSVLWMQTSAEYKIISRSAYRNAAKTVGIAINDPFWSAAVEQVGKQYAILPPAIIVDIDETMLDNSRSQAQDVRDRATYDITDTRWKEWVNMKSAPAIPGALEFVKWVNSTYPQVTVIYITNRKTSLKSVTLENLKNLGFPVNNDVLLTRDEGTDSDKSARRQLVSEKYRVLMLIGDDLGDFIPAKGTPDERVANAQKYDNYWGERWVMLPNPTYGSWERALPTGKDDAETLQRKFDTLKTVH